MLCTFPTIVSYHVLKFLTQYMYIYANRMIRGVSNAVMQATMSGNNQNIGDFLRQIGETHGINESDEGTFKSMLCTLSYTCTYSTYAYAHVCTYDTCIGGEIGELVSKFLQKLLR